MSPVNTGWEPVLQYRLEAYATLGASAAFDWGRQQGSIGILPVGRAASQRE